MKADNPGPIARKVLEAVTAAASGIRVADLSEQLSMKKMNLSKMLYCLSGAGLVVCVKHKNDPVWTIPGREAQVSALLEAVSATRRVPVSVFDLARVMA